jgi:hypothetical protein
MERTDYDKQAQEFLNRFGLTVKAAFGTSKCPPWDEHKHGCTHGDQYRVTIKRIGADRVYYKGEPGPRSISFDFWNSYADMRANKRPTAYDILACISSNAYAPTDPDEVSEEYGGVKPSQAIAVARFARRLQDFFSEGEIEALAEIH